MPIYLAVEVHGANTETMAIPVMIPIIVANSVVGPCACEQFSTLQRRVLSGLRHLLNLTSAVPVLTAPLSVAGSLR